MSTYANIKLSEIFALYGNPFSRGTCKKNVKAKLIKKYLKRINFEEIIKNDIQQKTNNEGNSKLLLLNKKENGLMLLKNTITRHNSNNNKSFIKIEHLFPKNESYKYSSKMHLNTDAFSVTSHKKRTQQELVRKTIGNFTSEENADNTKISSFIIRKYKENISKISQLNNKE